MAPDLKNLLQLALDHAELGIALELDADSIRQWRAKLDLPGSLFDVDVTFDHGDVHIDGGPVDVDIIDGDVTATVALPGPLEIRLEEEDGQVRGPRLVPDGTPIGPLERSTRRVVRAVRRGRHDEVLQQLLDEERLGHARERVVRALRLRQEAVAVPPEPAISLELVAGDELQPRSVTEQPVVTDVVFDEARALEVLSRSRRRVTKAVAAGEHDGELRELFLLEQAGKARRRVLAALVTRREQLDDQVAELAGDDDDRV